MGSTTTNFGLYKPASQEQNWDALVNANADTIDIGLTHSQARAMGFIAQAYNAAEGATGSATTSQAIDVVPIWIPNGKVITNVVLCVTTAGTSTAPTGFFVGLANKSKLVAQSNNLNASASLTALGYNNFALNATYTTNVTDSANGFYYVVVLQNGVFAGTNVQLATKTALAAAAGAYGANPVVLGTTATGQTAPPANNTAITVTAGTRYWWAGVA